MSRLAVVVPTTLRPSLKACLDSVSGLGATVYLGVGREACEAAAGLAETCGAKIVAVDGASPLSEQLNTLLRAAEGDWILRVDDDMTLDPVHTGCLKKILAVTKQEALNLVCVNQMPEGRTYYNFLPYLLKNRPSTRYRGYIHERLEGVKPPAEQPTMVRTCVTLHHKGFLSGAQRKTKRNAELIEREILERGSNPVLQAYRLICAASLGAESWNDSMIGESIELLEAVRPPRSYVFCELACVVLEQVLNAAGPVEFPLDVFHDYGQWFSGVARLAWDLAFACRLRGEVERGAAHLSQVEHLSLGGRGRPGTVPRFSYRLPLRAPGTGVGRGITRWCGSALWAARSRCK